jgi:hypothetical protein
VAPEVAGSNPVIHPTFLLQFFSQLDGGVRGKYYERATAGTTFVLLEPDVADAFPDVRIAVGNLL